MNKIFILEGKTGEVLAILTSNEVASYQDFNNICVEASEGTENDFYTIKDRLVNEFNFSIVDVVGGYICNKRRGAF